MSLDQQMGRYLVAIFAAALAGGAIAGAQPKIAVGLVGVVGVAALAWRAPVAGAILLLVLTVVVPYGIQNQLGIGGGVNSPGLLVSDLVLAFGMAWGLLTLARRPLERRRLVYGLAVFAFLGIAVLQFAHGVKAGHGLSQAGAELRTLLGFGAFFVVLPLLDQPEARRRLMTGLLGVCLALGAWGLIQWAGHVSFGGAGDVGVRQGVRLTTAGAGQLQGGEFGYPVALVVCFAVLVSGVVRSRAARAALLLAVFLNAACCLVTFERSFWMDALLGLAFVALATPGRRRLQILCAAPFVLALIVGALAMFAPAEFQTATQRLSSISDYRQDDSVRYRVTESRFVSREVSAQPLVGSGLAASIFWGQPWAQQPPKEWTFSHNGYLWLAWKVGIPATALLVLLLGSAAFLRAPPGRDDLGSAARRGAQGALLGLLLATMTFSTFGSLSITPAIGVLLALVVSPAPPREVAAGRPRGPWLRPVPTGGAAPAAPAYDRI